MDIFAENRRQMFTTEMQKETAKFPLKRARYYGSEADVNSLSKGAPYETLKDCYVIIITPQDPFGQNRMVYVSELKFRSGGHHPGDEKTVIYVNCSGTEGKEEYPDLVPFCRYVMGERPNDAFVKKIHAKVLFFNKNRDWRMRYMEWEQYRMELSRRAEEKGVKHGIRMTLKRAVKSQFRSLMEAGIDNNNALRSVRKDYPEFSEQALRKILGM